MKNMEKKNKNKSYSKYSNFSLSHLCKRFVIKVQPYIKPEFHMISFLNYDWIRVFISEVFFYNIELKKIISSSFLKEEPPAPGEPHTQPLAAVIQADQNTISFKEEEMKEIAIRIIEKLSIHEECEKEIVYNQKIFTLLHVIEDCKDKLKWEAKNQPHFLIYQYNSQEFLYFVLLCQKQIPHHMLIFIYNEEKLEESTLSLNLLFGHPKKYKEGLGWLLFPYISAIRRYLSKVPLYEDQHEEEMQSKDPNIIGINVKDYQCYWCCFSHNTVYNLCCPIHSFTITQTGTQTEKESKWWYIHYVSTILNFSDFFKGFQSHYCKLYEEEEKKKKKELDKEIDGNDLQENLNFNVNMMCNVEREEETIWKQQQQQQQQQEHHLHHCNSDNRYNPILLTKNNQKEIFSSTSLSSSSSSSFPSSSSSPLIDFFPSSSISFTPSESDSEIEIDSKSESLYSKKKNTKNNNKSIILIGINSRNSSKKNSQSRDKETSGNKVFNNKSMSESEKEEKEQEQKKNKCKETHTTKKKLVISPNNSSTRFNGSVSSFPSSSTISFEQPSQGTAQILSPSSLPLSFSSKKKKANKNIVVNPNYQTIKTNMRNVITSTTNQKKEQEQEQHKQWTLNIPPQIQVFFEFVIIQLLELQKRLFLSSIFPHQRDQQLWDTEYDIVFRVIQFLSHYDETKNLLKDLNRPKVAAIVIFALGTMLKKKSLRKSPFNFTKTLIYPHIFLLPLEQLDETELFIHETLCEYACDEWNKTTTTITTTTTTRRTTDIEEKKQEEEIRFTFTENTEGNENENMKIPKITQTSNLGDPLTTFQIRSAFVEVYPSYPGLLFEDIIKKVKIRAEKINMKRIQKSSQAQLSASLKKLIRNSLVSTNCMYYII